MHWLPAAARPRPRCTRPTFTAIRARGLNDRQSLARQKEPGGHSVYSNSRLSQAITSLGGVFCTPPIPELSTTHAPELSAQHPRRVYTTDSLSNASGWSGPRPHESQHRRSRAALALGSLEPIRAKHSTRRGGANRVALAPGGFEAYNAGIDHLVGQLTHALVQRVGGHCAPACRPERR